MLGQINLTLWAFALGDETLKLNGIMFEDFFLAFLLAVLCFYGITNSIATIITDKKPKNEDGNKDNQKLSHKSAIQNVITPILTLVLLIVLFLFVTKYQIQPIVYLMFFWWLVIAFYNLWEFVRYVFSKSFEHTLTSQQENMLFLAGYFTFLISKWLFANLESLRLDLALSSLPLFVEDFILMVGLTLWYFSISFFGITFLFLSFNKISICINEKRKGEKTIKKLCDFRLSNREGVAFYLKIDEKIKLIRKEKSIDRLRCLFAKIAWVVIGPVIMGVEVLVNFMFNFFAICINIVVSDFGTGILKLEDLFTKNQGRRIIVVSRFSLVFSLLVVFVIDKYCGVFSVYGSKIYEFVCSVILIPLFISQLTKLRETDVEV